MGHAAHKVRPCNPMHIRIRTDRTDPYTQVVDWKWLAWGLHRPLRRTIDGTIWRHDQQRRHFTTIGEDQATSLAPVLHIKHPARRVSYSPVVCTPVSEASDRVLTPIRAPRSYSLLLKLRIRETSTALIPLFLVTDCALCGDFHTYWDHLLSS